MSAPNEARVRQSQILLKILSKIKLFDGLGNGPKLDLISICKQKVYQEGEIIFEESSDSDAMYLIIKGYVDIVLPNNQLVATIKPGALFGEMGVFTGEKRSASALARTQVMCFWIGRNELDSLLLRKPVLGRDLLKNVVNMLVKKITENNILIEELTQKED